MTKYLFILLMFSFGCQKKLLNECQIEVAKLQEVNRIVLSQVKECPKCKECENEIHSVCDTRSLEYRVKLFSNAWKECVRELKQCRGGNNAKK